MPFNPLSILNGVVDATGAGGVVRSAIANASQKTGIDFNFLLGQAKLESGLNATAKAGTSSASGLYQFVDQSWLRVVKAHGAEHGLGWAANAISTTSSGRAVVSDPAIKRAILALRNDPSAASLMAAEHASDNKDALESATGRTATGTDLYMAHFLGLGGARSFLTAMQSNPDRSGAAMFPAAAHANRGVFYNSDGSAKSLSAIYSRFASKLDQSAAGASAPATSGLAATRLGQWGADVIPGNAEASTSDAAVWAQSTLERLGGATGNSATQLASASSSLMRPTPANARLAYMLLAQMGA
ncbi:lytic transglycosylase domain-containing protein [Sphingomonas sp. RB3P16]|uniref:lytic transglycosylase domain-containing protein n=1 Tax=Parasphingomonas frigoris TaxID=3096163 RepID=UPI002FC77F2C